MVSDIGALVIGLTASACDGDAICVLGIGVVVAFGVEAFVNEGCMAFQLRVDVCVICLSNEAFFFIAFAAKFAIGS